MHNLIDAVFGPALRPHAPGSLWSRIDSALSLHRSRTRLAALDDRLLADIGLDRARAEAEAARPVWDAPNAWKK